MLEKTHVGHLGNEAADVLAKQASQLPNISISRKLDKVTLKKIAHSNCTSILGKNCGTLQLMVGIHFKYSLKYLQIEFLETSSLTKFYQIMDFMLLTNIDYSKNPQSAFVTILIVIFLTLFLIALFSMISESNSFH